MRMLQHTALQFGAAAVAVMSWLQDCCAVMDSVLSFSVCANSVAAAVILCLPAHASSATA